MRVSNDTSIILSGQNAETAEAALLRMFKVEAVPFTVTLVLFDVLVSVSWTGWLSGEQLICQRYG